MNKIISLEILKDLENFFKNNLNNEITQYNIENVTNLKQVKNITYKNVNSQFPEVFFQISRTNFEYIDITTNENMQITNDCFLTYADKDNLNEFADNIERMIFILYKVLNNFRSDNILNVLIESVERDELQSKDLQTIKIIQFNFKIISLI